MLSFGNAATTRAQTTGEFMEWKAEAVDRSAAADALSRFYATMYNTRQIAVREAEVRTGDTPTDVMRREGSWPAYLGPANRLLDSVVCDLNPGACSRERQAASGDALIDLSRNVAATEPTDGDWSGLRPGATLRIPDYTVEHRYETIATSSGYLAKRFGSGALFETTGALAALYCNQPSSACLDEPPLTWDGDRTPPILRFDPRKFDPGLGSVELPKSILGTFVDPNPRAVLVAVPYLTLRQSIILPRTHNPAQIGLDDIQQSLPAQVLVAPMLRTETTKVLNEKNRDLLDRMMFLAPGPDPDAEGSDRIVTIYHFDKQAKLKHCVFRNLHGVQLYEWRTGKNGDPDGPVRVDSTDDGAPCAPVEERPVESLDHGTHTLGLLIGALEEFTAALPPGFTYFNVVHVPLDASQFESGTAPEATNRIGPVLAAMTLADPAPDVVSMSLSWPATGMEVLDKQILFSEELITFVVAAPQQEGQNECSRGPAGIKSLNGKFAENVISVVGLNLAGPSDHPKIVLLDGAGSGKACHEIGAFGALVGPVGEANGFALLKGASQATPLVAATVAELIRRLPPSGPAPRWIGQRLIATAGFSPELIDKAKATLLDSSGALRVGADQIVTATGCRVFGGFVRIWGEEPTATDFVFSLDGRRKSVAAKKQLLSFRNLDANRVLVVWIDTDGVHVEIGGRQAAMERRTIQFSPEWVDDSGGPCEDISIGNDQIPARIVNQLIIRKLGG